MLLLILVGKERRLELIRELRSTHALQAAGQKEKEEMRRMTLAAQDAKTLEKTKEAAVEKVIQDMTGGQVGQVRDVVAISFCEMHPSNTIV